MSVFVKGMEMPECCDDCFTDEYACDLWSELSLHETGEKRHPDCPLIEVKEPHGRLLDGDALIKDLENRWNVNDDIDFCNKEVWHGIYDAPTVIESECYDYEYERASDMRSYCERYEPTYNPEDGSM